jgi:ABC-type transport system involved in multi-copper enzyme maturation permease subunit
MKATFKAEFRKLFSLRSTYYILGLCGVSLIFFAFYANGIKVLTPALKDSGYLASQATQAISALAGLIGLTGLLLMTHEFRYNTSVYTFTASRSRTQVLLAKIGLITVFSVAASLVISLLSIALSALGVRLGGHQLIGQNLHLLTLLWHCLFFGWGMAIAALMLATLIRNQVGAVVTFLFLPGPVELLIGLLLKKNPAYLPFSALNQVLASPQTQGGPNAGHLAPGKAALVFVAYTVVGWLVAWYLFLKRDVG